MSSKTNICSIIETFIEGKKFHRAPDPETKATAQNQFLANLFPSYMAKIEKILKANGNTGYLVGNQLTYADIFVAYTIEQIVSWTDKPTLLTAYPEIKAHVDMVMNLPGIKEWILERPVTAS